MDQINALKQDILSKVKKYYCLNCESADSFDPGRTRIPYAGRVYDEKEIMNLVDAALEFWLTAGRYTAIFERGLADFLGLRYCNVVNSGSSANLLAFMALTSDKLGERRIQRQDEVITVASGFPTTISPIIQYGAIPVFVDVELGTYNVDVDMLEMALSTKTKAIVLAHTLGNPFNIKKVKEFCDKYHLWLIEDNCDALGSKYEKRYTGTFGDIGTSSFYPPHHITTGEGGAVYTDNSQLNRIIESLRDWGRDCRCPSGKDNTCGKRFEYQFGELPLGYDHKYVYSHFGYNLKTTDFQAAIGCAQLKKLPLFIKARQMNFERLYDGLKTLEEYFVFPRATECSEPSWFGFLLTVREGVGFTRDDVVRRLEQRNIQTRMLFAGNFTKQPCFDVLRRSGTGYRIVGDLTNTDRIMRDSFWVGVYPGMTLEMIDYIVDEIKSFVKSKIQRIRHLLPV